MFANKRQSICSLILFAAVVGRNRRSHSQLWKWQLRKIEKLSVSYLLLSVVFLGKEKYFNTNCLYVNDCKYKTLAPMWTVNASVWWKVVEGLPSCWCEGENMWAEPGAGSRDKKATDGQILDTIGNIFITSLSATSPTISHHTCTNLGCTPSNYLIWFPPPGLILILT